MFNFSFLHSLQEMKEWTNNEVVLFGQVPPRDVLAQGTPEQIANCVRESLEAVKDKSRIIMSCGGGMPDSVSTENINVFLQTVANM